MPSNRMNFQLVRKIGMALPGVEVSSLHGAPSLKASGRLLACPAIHKSAEPNSLMVRIGPKQRAKLVAAEPDVYYVTDHYANHPAVLVRLGVIGESSLKDLLALAWRFVNSKKNVSRRARRRPDSKVRKRHIP